MIRSFFTICPLIFFIFRSLVATGAQPSPKPSKSPAPGSTKYLYFLGDAGTDNLQLLGEVLSGVSKVRSSYPGPVLFLGNSIPEPYGHQGGGGATSTSGGFLAEMARRLGGSGSDIHFLPGETEWRLGLAGMQQMQRRLREETGEKDIFLPRNGCPLAKLEVNELADLLLIDSFWAIMDWDSIPGINSRCDIKSREDLFNEIESEIVQNQTKTLLIAMHHPLESLGPKGNPRSFGLTAGSLNHPSYRYFRERLETLAHQWSNVVFIGAHDRSLQLVSDAGIPMMISGSAGGTSRIRKPGKDQFALAMPGFLRLGVAQTGQVSVAFYANENRFSEPVYENEIVSEPKQRDQGDYPEAPKRVAASIYSEEQLRQSLLNKTFFGTHYKRDYLTPISAVTVNLDTLMGGLSVLRKGGGHQTSSLRLSDQWNREYTMRTLQKSALRFLQYFLYKNHYLNPEYEETYLLRILQAYWTTANPYGVLAIGDLSDAVDILHPNPSLYYVPGQQALGAYNAEFGDKLYFIEEHLSDGHQEVKSLGGSDEIISSSKLIKKLRNRNQVSIDKSLYIRTRLFDNLIGDWDRHEDQWRWAEFEGENGKAHYMPIPRDRDQAFSDFDGLLLRYLTLLAPPLRFMQRYDENYRQLKWFNDAGDDLDRIVLDTHTLEDWLAEARYIRKHLTADVIAGAFERLPAEVSPERKKAVQAALLGRLQGIEGLARDLYELASRHIVATGTDGPDTFKVIRKPDGSVTLTGKRAVDGGGEPFWHRTYDPEVTRTIWVYGLSGDDQFNVSGPGQGRIRLRIIGGLGNDAYKADNSKSLRVYDHRSQENTFYSRIPGRRTDEYDLNTYHFKKNPRTLSFISPVFGFEPDNQFSLGFRYNSEYSGLYRESSAAIHTLAGDFYTGTSGVSIRYAGTFGQITRDLYFRLSARYESPHHIVNFFGFGNESPITDEDRGREYNSVRIQNAGLATSLMYRGLPDSELFLALNYNYYQVQRTEGRFIDQAGFGEEVFRDLNFLGAEAGYSFDRFDSEVQPRVRLGWEIRIGTAMNLSNHRSFGYLVPELRLTNKVDPHGRLVVATRFKGHMNVGDHFEFFQAATLGGTDGPRGYRQQRFAGKQAFYHSTDLRLAMGRLNNGVLPTGLTLYGGFDYGRVWWPGETSRQWHTSYGGGLYLNFAGYLAGNLAYFESPEGGRLVLGLSIPF